MNVKKLKALLNKLPPEMDAAKIILASDSEGNSFQFLSDINPEVIFRGEKDSWELELFEVDFDAEEQDLTEAEWNRMKKSKTNRVILLYPA